MKHRGIRTLIRVVALLAIVLTFSGTAIDAQSYYFSVPLLQMQVFVQSDASVRIVYDITFENYGAWIDVVDIGLPHQNYDISTMSAAVDGVPVTGIYPSEYIDIGVEIHLGDQAIQQNGILHFECTLPDMVYQDTTNKELASLQIMPTWFDSSLVSGTGDIQIAVHLPAGIEADEVLYQNEAFTDKVLYEDHIVALWEWEAVSPTKAYQVGVSFPQRSLDRVVRMTLLDITRKWLADNPSVHFLLGLIAIGLLTWVFFRFTGGTGCVIYGILAVIAFIILVNLPLSSFVCIPVMLPLLILNERSLKKKKGHYLPPVAQVEGGGIKRGLTAPEAAVLLEMSLGKVLMLVIFGMLEKGLIEIVQDDPLKVRVVQGYDIWKTQEDRRQINLRHRMRTKEAIHRNTTLHKYEQRFLDSIERHPRTSVANLDLENAMTYLIKETAAKMKNFDLSDTQDYYKRVIERALAQASGIGEIEQRHAYLDKYLPWVMMNEDYTPVFTHSSTHYWPRWIQHTNRTSPMLRTSSGGASRGSSSGGRTSFGDVAASFTGWTENTMGNLAGTLLPSSLNLSSARGGVVNLGSVDRVTGNVFKTLMASSGSSGGRGRSGGSSCACACAGCACACACAGGGR